jgi:hypothetical protein
MISDPSSVIPLIAAQVFPRAGLPMILNTRSRRFTWLLVSRSCWMKAARSSFDCAAFAIFGSVFRILRESKGKGCAYIAFAVIPVLEDPFKPARPMPELFSQGWQRAGHSDLFLNSPTAKAAA